MKILRVIGGMVVEYVLIVERHVQAWLFPFPPKSWMEGSRGDIVLVPGFYEVWTFFRYLGNRLNKAGYRVHLIPGLRGGMRIAETADAVAHFLDDNGLEDVVLLSHSKGGLAAKYLLDHTDASKRVKRSISISTPYGGSWLGYLWVLNLDELLPSSPFLSREREFVLNINRITQLYSVVDNHVLPNHNLLLEGAENVMIDCIGHTRIFEDERTYEAIIQRIQ